MNRLYRKRRRYWRAMLLIVLLLTLILVGCGSSEPLYPKVATLSDTAVKKLSIGYDNYVESLDVEFAFCCYGYVEGDTLHIEDVELTWGYQTRDRVWYFPQLCSKTPIIMGHAHRNAYVFPSMIDIQTLMKSDFIGGVILAKSGNKIAVRYYGKVPKVPSKIRK